MGRLLIKIIKRFVVEAKKNKSIPLIVIFPYEKDLDFFKKNKKKYYSKALNEIKKFTNCIDLSDTLVKKNYSGYYLSSYYGSHFSKTGHSICSKIIYNYLKNIKKNSDI